MTLIGYISILVGVAGLFVAIPLAVLAVIALRRAEGIEELSRKVAATTGETADLWEQLDSFRKRDARRFRGSRTPSPDHSDQVTSPGVGTTNASGSESVRAELLSNFDSLMGRRQ